MSPCVHVGIQVGGLFANGPKQLCFEPYVDTMGERSCILLHVVECFGAAITKKTPFFAQKWPKKAIFLT